MKWRSKKSIDEEKREWLKTNAKPVVNAAVNNELLNILTQKFADLVESDEPLSPEVRKYIADELRRFYSSPFYSRRVTDERILQAAVLKKSLQGCGLTATAAEQDVAGVVGISVDALRKRFQRELHRWPRRDNHLAFLLKLVGSRR